MNPKDKAKALSQLAQSLADAAALRELIENASDVRPGDVPGADTWRTDLERAHEMLRRALAHVSRYAVIGVLS